METVRSPQSAHAEPNPKSKAKFSINRKPAISAVRTAGAVRPFASDILLLLFLSLISGLALFFLSYREESPSRILSRIGFSATTIQYTIKSLRAAITLILLIILPNFLRAFSVYKSPRTTPIPSKNTKEEKKITDSGSNKKPPKSRLNSSSEPILPIRKSIFSTPPTRTPRIGSDQITPGSDRKPKFSPLSPSLTTPKPIFSPITPFSKQSPGSGKRIETEADLQKYLTETDEKIERLFELSNAKAATPPATARGLAISSPGSITSSGTARSTPLRPIRMSPTSISPKKGEGDMPPPMSMEKVIEGYKHLGIYPQIEQWRDQLRQWFSSVLVHPLLQKIKTSHVQVMQAAASIGVLITVIQVGSETLSSSAQTLSPVSNGWQPIVTFDEDELLQKLQTSLLQELNKTTTQPFASAQQRPQNPSSLSVQACLDLITEHQRLKSLMKGELIKGLLPYSSVRADYTVRRVQELAEGTCLKNYEYMGTGQVPNKKWTGEHPSDSHLLLYLFAAYLEHPGWMLHVDTQWFSGAESSENPLFLGVLPPKERFPDKYTAVISGVPPVIHPGACVLSVSRQSPPTFCVYWDKKLQFSLHGRTAFWDAILLICNKIHVDYGGVVRGVHLASPALNILPVLDSDSD